ncbi:hypothetical protein EDB89DRAFT_1912714 [Lactarius sanguifluus]|nr:hypothetical protein EDB89DRAFT_1912714 [Lactarius sanguifluus]
MQLEAASANLRHVVVVVVSRWQCKWLGLVGDSATGNHRARGKGCFLWWLPTLNVQDYDIHNYANACPVPNTTTTACHSHPNDDYDTAGCGSNDDDAPTTVQNDSKACSNNNNNAIDINDERRQDGKASSNDDDDAIGSSSGTAITRQATATRMR